MMDMLICLEDKKTRLVLHSFQEHIHDEVTLPKAEDSTKVVCLEYCGNKELILTDTSKKEISVINENISKIDYESDCHECFKREIVAGILVCPKCNTYYPIIDDILIIKKPELRVEEDEKAFTEKWADNIKEALTKK
jgi:uncharacterized protein YbaR (Trm112 family)